MDQCRGGCQEIRQGCIEFLRKAQSFRQVVVKHHRGPAVLFSAQVHRYSQIARVAHQEQRRQVVQRVRQPSQRGVRTLLRFDALVACGAQRGQILERVGRQMFLVPPRYISKRAERDAVVHVVLASLRLGSAAVRAAEAVALAGRAARLRPRGPVIVR